MPSAADVYTHSTAYSLSFDDAESAARTLAHIDAMRIARVVKRNGHRHFVLSVFLRRSQPTTKLTLISATERYFRTRPNPQFQHTSSSGGDAAEPDGEPDYEVERRFSEFVELRHALLSVASSISHDRRSVGARECVFCSELLAFLEHEKKRQPRHALQYATTSSRRMSELLTAFTRDVVALVTSATSNSDSQAVCEAALQAAALLADFLHRPRDSSLGII